jgi:hypothetical protein
MQKFFQALVITILFLGFTLGVHAQSSEGSPEHNELLQRLEDEEVNFDGLIPSANYIDQAGESQPNTGRAGELGRKIENGTIGLKDMPIFIVKAIDLFSKIAGSVAVLMLMYGGIQYMFGELLGSKDKAKQTITYAISGLVLTFFAWLIINIVKTQLTGVDYFGQVQEEYLPGN